MTLAQAIQISLDESLNLLKADHQTRVIIPIECCHRCHSPNLLFMGVLNDAGYVLSPAVFSYCLQDPMYRCHITSLLSFFPPLK